MAEPHVISALRAKRAELSGDLIAAQKRLEKLRDDLDAVDRTLRVFDPRQHPEKIRPVVKRKGDRMFGYGECTRAILNALRDAPEPMTTAELAERVALDCRIATEAPDVAATLLARVQGRAGEAGQARGCERRGEAGAVVYRSVEYRAFKQICSQSEGDVGAGGLTQTLDALSLR